MRTYKANIYLLEFILYYFSPFFSLFKCAVIPCLRASSSNLSLNSNAEIEDNLVPEDVQNDAVECSGELNKFQSKILVLHL